MDAPARRAPPPAGTGPEPGIDYVIEVAGAPLEPLRAALEHRFAGRVLLHESDDSVQAGLQMLSRRGVVGEAELLEFRSQVETFAAGHGAAVSAPEMRAALEAAQALDRACAEVDIQIALHVVGGAQPAQERAGYQLAPRPDGVTFLLDVPRTPDLLRSYEAMVRSARELGGRLVDDNGNALDERALAAIGAELEAARSRLAELGIEPGSPLAMRLFS